MENYIDNVVLKLKRTYSKDELVSHLTKKLSEAEIEIGILKSEKEEAEFNLKKALKLEPAVKARVGQMTLYVNLRSELKSLRDKIRTLKLENSKMFEKIVKNNLDNLK